MQRLLFLSRTRQDGHFEVRPARNDDWLAIEKLLHHARRHYLALEGWTVREWLGRPTLLLATDQRQRPVGLMLAVVDEGPVAWLRAIATTVDGCLAPLLEASARAVQAGGMTGLAFLGDEGWVLSRLEAAGFRPVNRVVTLRYHGRWPVHRGPSGLRVRAATPLDLDAVLALDHAAFAPMWWYSRKLLRSALDLALCFHLAYRDDACVGYQFSTLRHRRGHIVRLATHPDWQRRGTGARLLSEALTALHSAGAGQITVNTQEDNWASLQLYRRFNFDRVGASWAVWFRSLD